MKILNLFAGIGGNRTLWGDKHEITAVENVQKIAMIYHKRFPNDKVIIGDAYKFLLEHYREFDFIWASPPCISHSRLIYLQKDKGLPDLRLYSLILFLKHHFHGKWIVENVSPYYRSLINYQVKLGRHIFWCNFEIIKKDFKIKWVSSHGMIAVSPKELCRVKQVDYILLKSILKEDKLKGRQLVRNAVLPEIGKYVLDSCLKQSQQTILNWRKER